MWTATQLRFELMRFVVSLHQVIEDSLEAALADPPECFDALWSRAGLAKASEVGVRLHALPVADVFGGLTALLNRSEPLFGGTDARGPARCSRWRWSTSR